MYASLAGVAAYGFGRARAAWKARRPPRGKLALPVIPSLRRRAGGGGGFLRYPFHLAAIVLEAFGSFEGVLGRVHDQIPFVVVLVGELHRIEGNRDVLFARPKKTADADDERGRFAALIDKHVHDLADLVVLRVIDVLLVPMGDGFAIAGDTRHDLSSRAAALLLGLRAPAWRNEGNEHRSIGQSPHGSVSFDAGT
jgi:hypothetical protein